MKGAFLIIVYFVSLFVVLEAERLFSLVYGSRKMTKVWDLKRVVKNLPIFFSSEAEGSLTPSMVTSLVVLFTISSSVLTRFAIRGGLISCGLNIFSLYVAGNSSIFLTKT